MKDVVTFEQALARVSEASCKEEKNLLLINTRYS